MRHFIGYCAAGSEPVFGGTPAPALFGPYQILCRGFIANRADLLAKAGRSQTGNVPIADAELFAIAYERWGTDLSRHVVGEFSLALFDAAEGRLLLAQDALGLAPVFYSESSGRLAFASSLEDLVIETGTGQLDDEFIADYMARGEHFGEHTPYAHIRRLLPGESLVWRGGQRRLGTWTLAAPDPVLYRDPRDYEERLRHLVKEAVQSALPPHGKVWCELSGGLDSSTILSVARRVLDREVEAVSFVYPQSYSVDEREWIEAVLKEHPAPWHPIDADAVRPFSELPTEFHAEPSRWVISAAMKRTYFQLLAAHGVDIVLSGEGGDAVLCGDEQFPFFLADLMLHGRWGRLWRHLPDWAEGIRGRRAMAYVLVKYALEPAIRHLRSWDLEYQPATVRWAADDFAARADLKHRGRARRVPRSSTIGVAYMVQRIMRSAHVVRTCYHHHSSGFEFRHPLLYRPLIEFMLAVPWETKIAPTHDRALQRRAFKGILPAKTLQRFNKGGGAQAMLEGLERSRAWHEALTARPRIVERGYARLQEWRNAVQHARVGQTDGFPQFLASAILELWLQGLERLPAGKDSRSLSPGMTSPEQRPG